MFLRDPRFFVAAVATLFVSAELSIGAIVHYEIDSAASSLTVSGSVIIPPPLPFLPPTTIPLQQQGPGSLTTKYEGTIVTDVTSSSIEVLQDTRLYALDNGSWIPGVPDPFDPNFYVLEPALGNYGGLLRTGIPGFGDPNGDVYLALRDIVFRVTSNAVVSLDPTGKFSTAGWSGDTVDGWAFANAGSPPTAPAFPFSNPLSAGIGGITSPNGLSTLTLPIDVQVTIDRAEYDIVVRFQGTVIAYAPEPGVGALLALGTAVAGVRRFRHRQHGRISS